MVQRQPPRDPDLSVDEDVATLVADVGLAAGRLGDEGGARALKAVADRLTGGAATVVVVGEQKRGKSSLVNALVGRPGLLPVDVDVATNVHLSLAYGPADAATVVDAEHPQGRPIDVAELPGYAALDPETGLPQRPDVLAVAAAVPAPLLQEGITLVDTPGVGGLVAGHADVTLATLSRADALLFVVSGASELTASECQFLVRAAQRIGTVFFVLAQTDKYPQWPLVLDRNRDLVREHAPRYTGAPWFPVSSRLKSAADELAETSPQRAARRLADSGFPALTAAVVERIAARATRIREHDAATVCAQVLLRLVDTHRRRERAAAHDPGLQAELVALRARLQQANAHGAQWQATLAERSKTLDRDLRLAFRRQLAALREQYGELARTGDTALLERLPEELATSVRGLWLDQETALRTGVAAVTAALAEQFSLVDEGGESLAMAFPDELRDLPAPQAATTTARGVGDTLDRILPSIGVGSLAATIAAPLPGVLPVAVGLAAVLFLYERRRRNDAVVRTRQEATRYLAQVLGRVDTELPPAVQATLDEALQRIRAMVVEGLAKRRAELTAAIAENERLRSAAAADLERVRAETAAALTELAALGDRLRPLLPA